MEFRSWSAELGTRIEPWQRRLDVGDHFLVVVDAGTVIYGVIEAVPRKRDMLNDRSDDPEARWARTWSKERKRGLNCWIDIADIDFPLKPSQFMLARELAWPSTQTALRVVLQMGAMGRA